MFVSDSSHGVPLPLARDFCWYLCLLCLEVSMLSFVLNPRAFFPGFHVASLYGLHMLSFDLKLSYRRLQDPRFSVRLCASLWESHV